MNPPDTGLRLWTYRRHFVADGLPCMLEYRAGLKAATSVLMVADIDHGWDTSPLMGDAALRNHVIRAQLPSGNTLEVEAGYYNWWNVAVAVRLNGALVHESHPGQQIILPERARKMIAQQTATGDTAYDIDKLKANRIPIAVDISLGLMFLIVGKYVGLTEAALSVAAVGVGLMIIQRLTKIDLLGGLASFGIIMSLLSAGFAWYFQDDDIVKQRSTIIGLIAASAFLADGLFGGKWLGRGLSRYIAYTDIVPRRLSLAMGAIGLTMAGANWLVATLASTDVWLFYTTFIDIGITFLLAFVAIRWSRRPGDAVSAAP